MLIPEEYVEILAKLGLSHTEAKVYITLLCLKNDTANHIHKESNVARQEVYRVLSDLKEEGLIAKILGKPAKFRPIPAGNAISILIQRRNKMNRQLRKEAIKRFRNFEIDCTKKLSINTDARFVLLSKSETDPAGPIDKLGTAMENAQKTVMCSSTLPLFTKVAFMEEHIWKKAVQRKVKFKFIISKKSNERSELILDSDLKNTDCFEVRWSSTVLPTCVLLVDEREAFCRMGNDLSCPVLWSTNPNFVSFIKNYFTMKWRSLKYS